MTMNFKAPHSLTVMNPELQKFQDHSNNIHRLGILGQHLAENVDLTQDVLNELQNKIAELISRQAREIGMMTAAVVGDCNG